MAHWYCSFVCEVPNKEMAQALLGDLRAVEEISEVCPSEVCSEGSLFVAFDGDYDEDLRKVLCEVSAKHPELTFTLNCEDENSDSFWREEMHSGKMRFLRGEKVYVDPSPWYGTKYHTKVELTRNSYYDTTPYPVGTPAVVTDATGDKLVWVRVGNDFMWRNFTKEQFEATFEPEEE